jgi:hypothetical protein
MSASAYKAFACEASRLFIYRHARESGHDEAAARRGDDAIEDSSRLAPELTQPGSGRLRPRSG